GGPAALKRIKIKTGYSSSTLINSVKEYLQTECSMLDIVKKYKLSGDSVLRTWLKWYNTPLNISIRNYKIKGIEALNDNRGITKKYENLTSEEILKLKLKESEEKYLRLEAEFELAKKLMALMKQSP
ncbi:MAG: hypothetical protein ACRCZ9_01740, partial [Fusobacteriaceae bacterium]